MGDMWVPAERISGSSGAPCTVLGIHRVKGAERGPALPTTPQSQLLTPDAHAAAWLGPLGLCKLHPVHRRTALTGAWVVPVQLELGGQLYCTRGATSVCRWRAVSS